MAKVQSGKFEVTLDEALGTIKNADGRVRFQLMVHAFLPTDEGRGFDGQACITVSRKDMLKAVADMGKVLCTDRGAKIRLHCTAATCKGGLAFIAVY